ncbi:MAG: T9SS type A sorting domain-containing protein [Crocinitomicaceae bacterium]|nr:T9SS type A sorting domain-containing protein [Crocinitomicaceae bacterium]
MRIASLVFLVLIGFTSLSQNEDVINHLTATEFNGKVLLTFAIKQGNTCNGVVIYHSVDFTSIGSIEGICGSSQEQIEYNFTHLDPEKNEINYYRLSLGGIGFSWIVSAEVIDLGANNALLRPNPISQGSELFFDNETNATVILNIYSSAGILVKSEWTTSELFILNAFEFESGMYFYSLQPEGIQPEVKGRFVVP